MISDMTSYDNILHHTSNQNNHPFPPWELTITYPIQSPAGTFESMIFLFPRLDMAPHHLKPTTAHDQVPLVKLGKDNPGRIGREIAAPAGIEYIEVWHGNWKGSIPFGSLWYGQLTWNTWNPKIWRFWQMMFLLR